MGNDARGLDNLIVWKKSLDLVKLIYQVILPNLPAEEKWGLASQIRRSSNSIHANIAEGYGRYYYQDNVRFCYIARGSLDETYSHIRVCIDLDYLKAEQAKFVINSIQELRMILNGYIQFIKKTKQGEKENQQFHSSSIHETQSIYESQISDSEFLSSIDDELTKP